MHDFAVSNALPGRIEPFAGDAAICNILWERREVGGRHVFAMCHSQLLEVNDERLTQDLVQIIEGQRMIAARLVRVANSILHVCIGSESTEA